MNCILQIMVHCPLVARFFLGDRHNRFECIACHGNVESSLDEDAIAPPRRPCLACEMDILLTHCFSGDTAPYSPHSFLHAMWCSCDHFAGYEQQDAHEFWIAVFSGICASLVPRASSPPPPGAPDANGARILLGKAASRDLQSIFGGQLRSQVKCARCGHTSTKLEDFHDVSLDISRMAGDGAGEAVIPDSLDACLRSFTREERLGEQNWCARCGALQDATKQLSFQRLPHVLCLHLKRFKQSASGPKGQQSSSSKIDTFVHFPLHSLNLLPHTAAALCAPAASATSAPPLPRPEHLYDLFGIAVHQGTMQTGHYTAFVRHKASWYHCDDAMILPATAQAVRACKAYMLFYVRKQVDGVSLP
jgi:ubiquitin carboxyl-terminal hydrolase 22/27/51